LISTNIAAELEIYVVEFTKVIAFGSHVADGQNFG
jgi:hypothetical protein